nr:MAG TPA: hypothetical protein [Caudoviricetes sp.]
MKIKVKGWSCKWFRLFLHESAALMCRIIIYCVIAELEV